jgi:PPP family 3-phenylpropionic acid transporter
MPAPPHVAVRPAVAVQVLFVLFGIAIAAFFPFLALFLDDRGLTPGQIGVVIAAMALARILTSPVWGHVADITLGRRTTLQIGAFGAALTAVALFLVEGYAAIVVVGFLFAAFSITTGPNIDAIALVHLGQERMGDYGRMRGWESLSYAAACLAIGFVLQQTAPTWTMPIYAVGSVAVVVWALTLPRDRPAGRGEHGRLGAVGAVFRASPRFWQFLVAVLLVWMGFNAAWNFFALRVEQEGGGPLLVGIGTALGGLIEFPVMRLSSRLCSRFGLRKVFVLGCSVYALNFLLWGLVESPTLVSLITVFEGMGFALLFTTSVVVIGRMLPASLYSTGNSLSATVGFGIGPILGAGLGGFVFESLGSATLYIGASALALAGGVAAWFALSDPALSEPGPAPGPPTELPPELVVQPPA